MKDLADLALDTARRRGATYADIRIINEKNEFLGCRNQSRGPIFNFNTRESYGFGVRVIADGAWGFASSPRVNKEEIQRISALAVEIAKAGALVKERDVRLAPVKAFKDSYKTPIKVNPFEVSKERKQQMLVRICEELLKTSGVFVANSSMQFEDYYQYFASTEGSYIEQEIIRSDINYTAGARGKSGFKSRTFDWPFQSIGFEHVEDPQVMAAVERVAAEAVEHSNAEPLSSPGRKDLILAPSHIYLTVHESIAHATELDRVVGYEANYAGTSFATLDKLGKMQWGSKLCNFVADRNMPRGLATVAYDDDGVPAQQWHLVKDGLFVGYQTNRETAHLVNEKESRGCSQAVGWYNYPFLRMPNVHMWWGPEGSPTPDEMIADVKDGILIDGRGSYSIDQQRLNFQFGGNAFWEIKNGKKTRMITDVTYYAMNTDFWKSVDAVSGREHWVLHGTGGDSKGEPAQSNSISHGCPWVRVRQIQVARGGAL
ncbi:MAG TPA: TldD/PmbA family protein [Blastocatellia bacterium]|nr:TldD/PmbA family protein [Blastocatellia bacterium]